MTAVKANRFDCFHRTSVLILLDLKVNITRRYNIYEFRMLSVFYFIYSEAYSKINLFASRHIHYFIFEKYSLLRRNSFFSLFYLHHSFIPKGIEWHSKNDFIFFFNKILNNNVIKNKKNRVYYFTIWLVYCDVKKSTIH